MTALPAIEAPLRLLAIGAHPDDAEISCGGTIAAAVREGFTVGILDLTRGELGTNGTPEVRAAEAEAAARVLGVTGRWNAGLPDGGLDPHEPVQTRRLVESLRALRPEIVVSHFPHDRHPDHVAASALVDRAIYLAGLRRFEATGAPHRPRARYHFASRVGFTPSFVVDVTETWATKREAILAHRSQVARDGKDVVATAINREGFLEVVESRARHYGGMIGVRYGEPFHMSDPIGVRSLASLFGSPRPAPGAFTG